MNFIQRISNLFQRKYYMPAVSVVFFALMVFAFVKYIRNFEPLDLPQNRSWGQIVESDTLHAITIPASYTAFEYRGKWYGYEYDLIRQVADSLRMHLVMHTAYSEKAVIDSLFSGAADISVWPISQSVASDYWYLRPTGPRWEDSQVVATMRKLKPIPAEDTLTHYRITIPEDSRQWQVFHDDSVRQYYDFDHFVIDTIPHDSLTIEELTETMVKGRTEAIMMRTNVAKLMKSYYPTLKISVPLPNSNDAISWFAITGADTLRRTVDSIMSLIKVNSEPPFYSVTHKRYFQQSKGRHGRSYNFHATDGQLSPYDSIFKRCAEVIDWDWRLLASIAYIESKFDHTQISSRGPIGLMQLMPATVRNLNYTEEEVIDPSVNVTVAVKLIERILNGMRHKLPEVSKQNLICFTIAGYNIGPGHIYDAINLAEELGYNPLIWDDNVEQCLRLKADPKYYGMSVVKLGPCNGNFTINYLHEVLETYEGFCKAVPRGNEN